MVAMSRAMLGEDAADGFGLEQTSRTTSRLREQPFDFLQLRAGQPIGPRGGESHFLAENNIFRQKVRDRFLQNELPRQPFDLLGSGNSRCEFHQRMIEKGTRLSRDAAILI